MNETNIDMVAFKEELEEFYTDDFVSVGEFVETYREELSGHTRVDLNAKSLTFTQMAAAIEEAQERIFGHSVNDEGI